MSFSLERLVPLALVVIAIGALAMALTAEHVFRLEPCILCLYQRIPYVATGILGLLALRLEKSLGLLAFAVALAGLAYLGGAGIAAYHVGVERHWWMSGCTGQLADGMTIEQLRASLLARPEKPCDDVDWTLFGLSITTYNMVFSAIIGAATLAAAWRMVKNNGEETDA